MADKRISELISTNIVDPADNFVLQRGATNLRILGSDLIAALEGTTIAGKDSSALAQAPTATEDGYAITWDNTAGEYNLTAAADPTKIATQATDALVQAPTATEDGYVIAWNNTNNEYELVAGGGGGGIYGSSDSVSANHTATINSSIILDFDVNAVGSELRLSSNDNQSILLYNGAAPVGGNNVGIGVKMLNSVSTLKLFGSLKMVLTDVTNGAEDSEWTFSTFEGGTVKEPFKVRGSKVDILLAPDTDAAGDPAVLTRDASTGEIKSVLASTLGGGADQNGIFDATNDGGTIPTLMDATITDKLTFQQTAAQYTTVSLKNTNADAISRYIVEGDGGSLFQMLYVGTNGAADPLINPSFRGKNTLLSTQSDVRLSLSGLSATKIEFTKSVNTSLGDVTVLTTMSNAGNWVFGTGTPSASEKVRIVGDSGDAPLRVDTSGINNALLVDSNGTSNFNKHEVTLPLTAATTKASTNNLSTLLDWNNVVMGIYPKNDTVNSFSLFAWQSMNNAATTGFGVKHTALGTNAFVWYTNIGGAGVQEMRLDSTGLGVGSTVTPTAIIHASASTTAKASLRLEHGVAPTAPNDGDIWTTTAGLFVRINGVTVGPLS